MEDSVRADQAPADQTADDDLCRQEASTTETEQNWMQMKRFQHELRFPAGWQEDACYRCSD